MAPFWVFFGFVAVLLTRQLASMGVPLTALAMAIAVTVMIIIVAVMARRKAIRS